MGRFRDRLRPAASNRWLRSAEGQEALEALVWLTWAVDVGYMHFRRGADGLLRLGATERARVLDFDGVERAWRAFRDTPGASVCQVNPLVLEWVTGGGQ
jgi:hypothetical protein